MNFKKSLTPVELEAILTAQLRLFLSVDVVGSTAFKHRKAQEGESKPWLKFIHGFYTGFVGKEGEDLSRHDKWLCMMYPRLMLLKQFLADDGAIFVAAVTAEAES